jgi:hypothetical protein
MSERRMMFEKFTLKAQEAIQRAEKIVEDYHNRSI